MDRPTPELPQMRGRFVAGHTMVSISSLRKMHRLLLVLIALQVVNLAVSLWGMR